MPNVRWRRHPSSPTLPSPCIWARCSKPNARADRPPACNGARPTLRPLSPLMAPRAPTGCSTGPSWRSARRRCFAVSELATLRWGDIEADGGHTITLRRSKTDQEAAGAALYIGEPTVFVRLHKGGRRAGSEPISATALRAIIARRCAEAGVQGRVSGHSLRIGAVQDPAAAGASLVEMQQAGRWLSPTMLARYARGQLATRPGAAGSVRVFQEDVRAIERGRVTRLAKFNCPIAVNFIFQNSCESRLPYVGNQRSTYSCSEIRDHAATSAA